MGSRAAPAGGLSVALAVLVRPWLWATALRQLFRLSPRRWWSRSPHLPVPTPEYLEFRSTTAYGDPQQPLDADDVVTWLTWCRSWGRATKVRSGAGHHG